MSATFITATGTDVGKTFVTAALIRHLRATGRVVDALKPVASGYDPDKAETSDPGMLLTALERPVTPVTIERIAPWRFAAPVSPDLAAKMENRPISFDALLAFCRRAIEKCPGSMLIEGIGGVMVPLDNTRTVLDWIFALKLPIVLVTGSYLGSLSHTLTSLDAVRRRDIVVKVLVVNETPGATVPIADTMDTLKRFAGAIPVLPLPRLKSSAAQHMTFTDIAALV